MIYFIQLYMLFSQIRQKMGIYPSKSYRFVCLWVLKSIILGKSFFEDIKS